MSVSIHPPQNPLLQHFRADIPGRFNEIDMLQRHWDRVVRNFDQEILPPFEVLIHPSSTCNLRCVWCIGDHVPIEERAADGTISILDASKTTQQRLPDVLADPESMLRLIRGIVAYRKVCPPRTTDGRSNTEYRVENVSFSGLIGEPLVSKKAVMAAMEYLIEHNVRVGMFTNGILMDASTYDTIVRAAYIHLSLDAGSAETYASLKCGRHQQTHAFHQAVRNLRGLVRARQSTPGSQLAINASFILYPENFREVYDAASLLKDVGVETLRIKHDISGKRLLDADQQREASHLLDRVHRELVDDTFRLVEIHRLDRPGEQIRRFSTCRITDLMAAVGSDGNLYPCNYHPRPGGASYGSVVDVPFKDVWEGYVRRNIKHSIPKICPAVCDPFKNRANRLLEAAHKIYTDEGLDALERYSHAVPPAGH